MLVMITTAHHQLLNHALLPTSCIYLHDNRLLRCCHGQFNPSHYSSCMYHSIFWSRSQCAEASTVEDRFLKASADNVLWMKNWVEIGVMHISWKRKPAVCIFISLHTRPDSNSSERPQMPVLNADLVVHEEWMTTTRNMKKNMNQKALFPTLRAYTAFYRRLNWTFATRTE